MKIGIFGGSFNPPHLGHIYISYQAKKILNLDIVLWLVTPLNPLKKKKDDFTELQDRVNLCKEITRHYSFMKIISIEDSFNLNYSYLILRKISALKNKDNKIFWIMGEDNLANIDKFKNWQEILAKYDCNVFARSTKTYQAFFKKHSIFNYDKKIKLYLIPKNNLSSTKIRKNLKDKHTND